MKNRLKYIDIAKGIAIICIILGHLENANINRIVFTFHVPIFFFITGCFTNKKKSIGAFIKEKVRTLLVPYVLTCLLIILIGSIEGYILGDFASAFIRWCYASIYGAGDSYMEPFYIPAIGALWFLLAIFWGSCFLRISLNFSKYLRISFILLLFIVGYYSRLICWFPLSIQAGACATLFLYIGFLYNEMKNLIFSLPKEIKLFGLVWFLFTWYEFIRDFQSFWLVHCDIGRGIIDIWGCVCACSIVIVVSKFIEQKSRIIGNILAECGKYSLLVLCVHIIELNLFPWWKIANKLVELGMSEKLQLSFIITSKLLLDLLSVYVLSKMRFVRWLYGYER